MSRAVARLILGLKPWHTRAAADSALKRLVTTVHPDVCHGPDAKRLTQLALDARSALLSVKPPRLFGVERGADGIWTMKCRSAIRPVVGEVVTYDVPGLRAGAAHVVSDGAGGALCGFGGVDGVSTVSRGPRRSRGAPLGGASAAYGVGTSMVRARP